MQNYAHLTELILATALGVEGALSILILPCRASC